MHTGDQKAVIAKEAMAKLTKICKSILFLFLLQFVLKYFAEIMKLMKQIIKCHMAFEPFKLLYSPYG